MQNKQNQSEARARWHMAVAVVTALLLSGCATQGPGYSAQPVAPNRYMLSLSGSTPGFQRDAEEKLIRRAALLTLSAGYTHFALSAQDVDGRTYFFHGGDTFLHGPDYARRAGLWPEYPKVPETYYLASAEVTMLMPDEAAGNPQAIDARAVL
jgi:hypothetical protein